MFWFLTTAFASCIREPAQITVVNINLRRK
jgi:hypothetical protein